MVYYYHELIKLAQEQEGRKGRVMDRLVILEYAIIYVDAWWGEPTQGKRAQLITIFTIELLKS